MRVAAVSKYGQEGKKVQCGTPGVTRIKHLVSLMQMVGLIGQGEI